MGFWLQYGILDWIINYGEKKTLGRKLMKSEQGF